MRIKRIHASIIVGLLLLMLILPQLALADIVPGSVSVTDITDTSAEIAWTTNTTSDSKVNYGITTALGSTKYDSAMVTNHNIVLTGLTQDKTYYFEVISGGERSPVNPSEYYTFKTLAPTTYSITLDHACGVCGELIEVGVCGEVIEVTAVVAAAGTYTYHVCWDSRAEANVVGTFTASGAGIYTLTFFMPEAKKGDHTVYLTDNTYAEKASAIFTVNPSVKINPEEGPVGTAVTLNGYGFTASQDIQVKFKDTVIATTKANSVGSWEVSSYTIPATPRGGYIFKVEAKEGTVWVGWVNKNFTVTPKITATPSLGTVEQTIKIDGTGFASEEEGIKVTFDGEVVKSNILPADVNGSWSAFIVVPPCQVDTYLIDASGELTRARDVPDVEFIVGAGVSVEPSLAYVGDTITVAGGGFAPGETGIKVTFDGQVVAADIPADTDGVWESSFVLPVSTYGSHTVGASGDTTKPAVTTTLNTKAKIEELSPVEGSPGDSVSLTGSGFSANEDLTVTVGGVTVSGSMQAQSNGNVAISFHVPKGVAVGKQTVKVTDEGGATDSVDFTVKEKVLPTPLPTLPADESKLRSGVVTFQWQGITSGSDVTYILQISETAGFTSIFRSKSGIEELSYQLTKEEALPKGTYYWRVKAVDDYDNESGWSDSSMLTASPIPTWVWVVVGIVVLIGLMVVAYRETKFKVTE